MRWREVEGALAGAGADSLSSDAAEICRLSEAQVELDEG